MRRSVSIIVYQGEAFLPTQAFSDGFWIDVEPVYKSNLELMELTSIIRELLEKENPIFPELTPEEWNNWHKQRSVVLKATKTRSWKQLAKNAALYSIYLKDEHFYVSMSQLDKMGRWEWDPNKKYVFSQDDPLENIIKLIVNDAISRSNLNLVANVEN